MEHASEGGRERLLQPIDFGDSRVAPRQSQNEHQARRDRRSWFRLVWESRQRFPADRVAELLRWADFSTLSIGVWPFYPDCRQRQPPEFGPPRSRLSFRLKRGGRAKGILIARLSPTTRNSNTCARVSFPALQDCFDSITDFKFQALRLGAAKSSRRDLVSS